MIEIDGIYGQLAEDIWHIKRRHFTVDVGWYPQHVPYGHFRCRLVRDDDWECPVLDFKTTCVADVLGWVADTSRMLEVCEGGKR